MTQKQESLMHLVKINDTFFKQRNLKPAICVLTHILNNQNQVSEVREAFGGKVNGKQSRRVDSFERNPVSQHIISIFYLSRALVLITKTQS